MYIVRTELREPNWSLDLNQGDIVAGLLFPKPLAAASFCVREGSKIRYPAEAKHLAEGHRDLRVMVGLVKEPFALVLTNSCDNSGGELPISVCPIRPFSFKEGLLDAEKWRQVSVAATGTANPKQFYLPACTGIDMPRSTAALPLAVPLTHDYIKRCLLEVGARRVVGLSDAAVRHLQRSLDIYNARNPREDHEWPSPEDLLLKLEWLKSEIARGSARHEEYKDELHALERKLKPSKKDGDGHDGAGRVGGADGHATVVPLALAAEGSVPPLEAPREGGAA